MRNGIYWCVIHGIKYIVGVLCIFEELFYYYECRLRNFYKSTCAFIFLWWNQKLPRKVFYKKAVLKNFATVTGKHLCWSLFLIKLQIFRLDSKKDSNTGVLLWICKIFKNSFFEEHLMKRSLLHHKYREKLIHSKTNIWVQRNYNYDSFLTL